MTLLEQIAQERTNLTLYTNVSVAVEKIATEISRELLSDPSFRAELKALARQSFGRAVRDLRAPSRQLAKRRRAKKARRP